MVHGEKRRGRRARILYWFRTPPGVKVGRAALDPDAIKLIEAHNPDVQFDWPRLLKGGDAPPEPRTRQEPSEGRRGRSDRGRSARPAEAPAPAPSATPEPQAEEPVQAEGPEPVEAVEAGELVPEPVPILDTPAGRRLGAEALARLRARYAEILARIEERPDNPDVPGERDELKVRAERLNPDAWVTDEEVTAGLEQYEAVYESLRSVVGRRRRGRPADPASA